MRESNARTGSWLIPAAVIGAGAVYAAAMIQRRSRYIQLTGRTVLITGGSRGLGLALAREFARHGATLAICGRDETTLEAARADLRQITPRVLAFPCDVRVEGQTREMVRRVEQAIGPIDILVNNAGTIAVGPQEAMTAADFQEAMDSNFWSAVHATLAVTPSMQARREGRIVNITSIGGKIPVPHLLPYCASKFAFVGFSSGLRTELSKSGVLVTTVVPGLMKTGSPRNADFKGKYRAEYAWFSISDNLPGISVSARRAARRIVRAAIYGEAEVTLGLTAKAAAKIHGVAPGLFTQFASLINYLLPGDGASESNRHKGRDSESIITQLALCALGRGAEKRFNQLGDAASS